MKILNEAQTEILHRERAVLEELRLALFDFGVNPEDHKTLSQSILQLDDLFLLVIIGEFNAGKSAFINALLGSQVLKEGVTPTTTQINVLRYGEQRERRVETEHLHVLTAPVEMLQEISIVDTPGTNAIIREHEAITAQFVPRSDLVLFITSADRPFTESERAFLEKIRDWGKKVVVVLNKTDLFQDDSEVEQVRNFIAEHARQLFGVKPEIFPVSTRLAQRAKQGEAECWDSSRFETLENYIHNTLDERGRLRLKFNNPLGIGIHLVNKYRTVIRERTALIQTDLDTLADVEAQLAVYREDMAHDFKYRMADLENVLFAMEKRGQEYFDETLRIARLFDLLNKERIQHEFEQQVVGDAPEQVELKVAELIDWLVDSDLRQWQAVMEHLVERRRQHKERIVGDALGSSFHHDRERLIEAVGRDASRVVETYDKSREAEAIAIGAQTAVAALAAAEVGAVGLGTLIAILATTVTADITGVLLASVMAALGLFVIPARRRAVKNDMRMKIGALRQELTRSLETQFEKEINRSLQRILDAISPYSRFVRAEQAKLAASHEKMEDLTRKLLDLQAAVEEI